MLVSDCSWASADVWFKYRMWLRGMQHSLLQCFVVLTSWQIVEESEATYINNLVVSNSEVHKIQGNVGGCDCLQFIIACDLQTCWIRFLIFNSPCLHFFNTRVYYEMLLKVPKVNTTPDISSNNSVVPLSFHQIITVTFCWEQYN